MRKKEEKSMNMNFHSYKKTKSLYFLQLFSFMQQLTKPSNAIQIQGKNLLVISMIHSYKQTMR
jgi:hypothetical protein